MTVTKMWTTFAVLDVFILLCLVLQIEAENNTCFSTYNKTSGEIKFHAKSDSVDKSTNCPWTITFNTSSGTDEVLLVLEEFHLHDGDSLTIERNGNGTPLNVGPFLGTKEPFMVLTGSPNIIVTLKTGDQEFPRRFQMRYYTQPNCSHSLISVVTGTILTPFYDVSRTAGVNCSLTIAVKSKDSFKLDTMLVPSNVDDNLHLNITETQKLGGYYSGSNIPFEFISEDTIQTNLLIKPNGKLQQIRFIYQAVTKECSDMIELSFHEHDSYEVKNPLLTSASVGDTPSLNCRTLIFTTENVVGLSVDVNARNLTGVLDQMIVQNGTQRNSSALLHLTCTNAHEWEDQYILTNQKEVSISIVSSFPSPQLNASVTVRLLQFGGYFEGSGQIKLEGQKNEPVVFLLKVDPTKQVKLDLTNKTSLPLKKASLDFFDNFEKTSIAFAHQSGNFVSFISPSPLMMIVANGFNPETFEAKFDSIERGCFETSTDDVGSYNVFGKCVDICAWTIAAKPNKTELRKLHFSSLFLNMNETLRVVHDGKDVAVNIAGPLRQMDDLFFTSNVSTSVILQRNCSLSGTSLVADFASSPKCGNNLTLTSGQSVVLSSPGYPNGYPINSQCKWKVNVPQNAVIHVEFQSLHLGSIDHSLELNSLKDVDDSLVVRFTGANRTLPRDYVLNSNLSVVFTSPSFNSSNSDSTDGFLMKITAADCGGEFLQKNLSFIETPLGKKANTTDVGLCVWLVGLPEKGNKSIIHYNATNTGGSFMGVLKVYEGCSTRDVLANLTSLTSVGLLSRRDHILVVYTNPNASTAPGPSLNLTYSAHECNASQTCGNGLCLHSDWICNGVNDCGDWSDEKYCSPYPPTPPGPTPPTPEPSKPVSGVSNTALALGILAALLIGALLGFAAPAAYRRIRTGQFGGSNYSSFSNAADA